MTDLDGSRPPLRSELRMVPKDTAPPPPGAVLETPASPSRALLLGLCPRCRRGRIFASLLAMNRDCPGCGLTFEREPGYFTGAMYVSYGLGIPILGLLAVTVRLVRPALSIGAMMAVAGMLFLPFVPLVFRMSRVIWIHVDRAIDRSP